MKLQRWRLMFNNGAWCKSDDVAELEAKYAELEVKYAELEAIRADVERKEKP